jgi:aspartate-semialdehyde dehydrogenase
MVGSVLMQPWSGRDFDSIQSVLLDVERSGKSPRSFRPAHCATPMRPTPSAASSRVTCQGGDWTDTMFRGFATRADGFWIDAASALRMRDDRHHRPVSRDVIDRAVAGMRNYIGGNCTVSLMVMALAGRAPRPDLWITHDVSGSGAGAQNMRELLQQMGEAHLAAKALLEDPRRRSSTSIREVPARDALSHGALRRAARRLIRGSTGPRQRHDRRKGGAELTRSACTRHRVPVPSRSACAWAMRVSVLTIKLKARRQSMDTVATTRARRFPTTDASIAGSPAARQATRGSIGGCRKLAMGPYHRRSLRRSVAVGGRRAAAPDAADPRPPLGSR